MKNILSIIFLLGVIISTPSMSISAQEKQYYLNENRSEVSLKIDMRKSHEYVNNAIQKRAGQSLLEARIYPMSINMDTIGVWSESISKKENIWHFKIDVPLSKGFYISLDDFYLPKGSQLFVYNENSFDKAIIFTHDDNPNGGPYSLEDINGDNVILEYIANKNITEKPRIHLSDVGYKYSDESGSITGLNSSGSCMININCTQGSSWQTQKKGIVRLRLRKTTDGFESGNLCTGTLINNTSNDKTPYILTAYHCIENVDITNPDNFSFFFDYEQPACENSNTGPSYKYHRGANVKVLNPINEGSDGVLLQLTEAIPSDWDVYFNGWDRTNNSNQPTSGAIIHHPEGDVKKITLYNSSPASGRWNASSPSDSYWIVSYSEGATEGGSSGGPMFNQNGLIVGTLTGGMNSCSTPTLTDYYGKFWYHWNQSADTNARMSTYLDPANTGKTTLSGLQNNESLNNDLVLNKSNISVLLNRSSEINIISGNGEYTTTYDKSRVDVAISGNTISIKGLKLGVTEVIVTDKNKKTKTITVYIRKDIDISILDNSIIVSIYNDTDQADSDKFKKIRIINLDGDVLYNKDNISDTSHTIDMTLLKNSIYIIQIKTEKGTTKAEKILWQK